MNCNLAALVSLAVFLPAGHSICLGQSAEGVGATDDVDAPVFSAPNADPPFLDVVTTQRVFSLQLHRQLSRDASARNLLCSPYDAFQTLVMLELGAEGTTQKELQTITRRTSDRLTYADAMQSLHASGFPTRISLGAEVRENHRYGVAVEQVADWQSGLAERDLIFTVDDEVVRTSEELKQLIESSTGQVQVTGFEYAKGRGFERAVDLRRIPLRQAERSTWPLLVANGLWIAEPLQVNPDYAKLIESSFGAQLQSVRFGGPNAFAKRVGEFMATRFEGRAVLTHHSPEVTDATAFVITNGVDFRRDWEWPFDARKTTVGDFLTNNGNVKASYMQQRDWFRYAKHENYRTLDLPYLDSALSMLFVLPEAADHISKVESAMLADPDLLLAAIRATPTEVQVEVPRFSIRGRVQLKAALRRLGIHHLFEKSAELHRMVQTNAPGNKAQPIWLDDIYQHVYLAVNEQGTVAESQTTAVGVSLSASNAETFQARRPFLFFIHDEQGAIFFSGRVMIPDEVAAE